MLGDAFETSYVPLQTALRAAGVGGLSVDYQRQNSTPLIMSIEKVTGADSLNLTAILRTALSADNPASVPRPAPPQNRRIGMMTHEQTVGAHEDLAYALAQAQLHGLTLETQQTVWHGQVVHIRNLREGQARDLATLLVGGLADHYAAASDLHAALHHRGLNADEIMPAIAVRDLRIPLGEITLPTAMALGTALGATPYLTRVDLDDYHVGTALYHRLTSAIQAVDPGLVDMLHHPTCGKCLHIATVELNSLTLPAATALTDALRQGQP